MIKKQKRDELLYVTDERLYGYSENLIFSNEAITNPDCMLLQYIHDPKATPKVVISKPTDIFSGHAISSNQALSTSIFKP